MCTKKYINLLIVEADGLKTWNESTQSAIKRNLLWCAMSVTVFPSVGTVGTVGTSLVCSTTLPDPLYSTRSCFLVSTLLWCVCSYLFGLICKLIWLHCSVLFCLFHYVESVLNVLLCATQFYLLSSVFSQWS